MTIETNHHEGEPVSPEDPEYLRRCRDAMSAYAALEIEAWQLACATEPTASASTGRHRMGADRRLHLQA